MRSEINLAVMDSDTSVSRMNSRCLPVYQTIAFTGPRDLIYCVSKRNEGGERDGVKGNFYHLLRHYETLSAHLLSFNRNNKPIIYYCS